MRSIIKKGISIGLALTLLFVWTVETKATSKTVSNGSGGTMYCSLNRYNYQQGADATTVVRGIDGLGSIHVSLYVVVSGAPDMSNSNWAPVSYGGVNVSCRISDYDYHSRNIYSERESSTHSAPGLSATIP